MLNELKPFFNELVIKIYFLKKNLADYFFYVNLHSQHVSVVLVR